jgi:glycosyltransferase involved in cell wall biosynthesis
VPPKQPQALAERLAWLVQNPQAGVEMGWRGRKRMAEEFSLDAMVKRTEAFYQAIMQGRRRGGSSPAGAV